MNYIILVFFYILVLVLSPVRYITFLPTIPVYPNSHEEVAYVRGAIKRRTQQDIDFHNLTDPSVSHAFAQVVPLSIKELNKIILQVSITFPINFYKYTINRPRPYQFDNNLDVLPSKTAHTPAYPAGHAYHAYYLAKKLGEKYPDKQMILDDIAEKCNEVRIKAGLHYPSDGEYSKILVDYWY
tara:strand:- start:1213 stop:1761 length:549 start_codon:yes stop_codon:yes gene_type:complete